MLSKEKMEVLSRGLFVRIEAKPGKEGDVAAFLLLLSRSGDRTGGLRLWFCAWRRAGEPHHRRCGRGGGGADLRQAAAA